jgi:hypothetical protein
VFPFWFVRRVTQAMAATLRDEFTERAGRSPGHVRISTGQTTTSISITIDSAFPLPSDTTVRILGRCRDQCTLAERIRYEVSRVDVDRYTSLVAVLKRPQSSLSVSCACTSHYENFCAVAVICRSYKCIIQKGTLLVAFAFEVFCSHLI